MKEKIWTKGNSGIEPGYIYASFIFARCVDKDGNLISRRILIKSEEVEKLCIWNEEKQDFFYVVPDDDIEKNKLKDRYTKNINHPKYLTFK